jgi:hypothetical protein
MEASPREVDGALTPEEDKFVHAHVIMGLSLAKAAKLSGFSNPYQVSERPRVAAAIARMRDQLRLRSRTSREDVIDGIKDAIEQAKLLGDPRAQITGWVELNRILGYDIPKKLEIAVTGNAANTQHQLRQMGDAELLQLADDSKLKDAIDVDFVRVDNDGV